MKVNLIPSISITILFFIICQHIFCQQNEDSILITNSEKWKVKQNKGMFGLSRPQFGPYTTLYIGKAEVPVIKKKTKDSTYLGADISDEGTGLDQSKFLTIAKTKEYTMQLSSPTDTATVSFSIASVSKEKRQTLLSKMLNKNDEEGETLSYNRDLAGEIRTDSDGQVWTFLLRIIPAVQE